MPTAVRINHQQVDGVTAHVQHTQSHGFKPSRDDDAPVSRPAAQRPADDTAGVPVVAGIVD
jgi:hypothetical protein